VRICFIWILIAGSLLSPRISCAEDALPVTVCQLLSNPAAYNHRLVEVAGAVTFSFEDFTLSGGSCHGDAADAVWVEYGGFTSSGAMYCCGVTTNRLRPAPLVIDGFATTLLVDAEYRAFDQRLRSSRGERVQARLVGRYFAGSSHGAEGHETWGGYGHMGMFTLLVIQEVISSKQGAPNPRLERP